MKEIKTTRNKDHLVASLKKINFLMLLVFGVATCFNNSASIFWIDYKSIYQIGVLGWFTLIPAFLVGVMICNMKKNKLANYKNFALAIIFGTILGIYGVSYFLFNNIYILSVRCPEAFALIEAAHTPSIASIDSVVEGGEVIGITSVHSKVGASLDPNSIITTPAENTAYLIMFSDQMCRNEYAFVLGWTVYCIILDLLGLVLIGLQSWILTIPYDNDDKLPK